MARMPKLQVPRLLFGVNTKYAATHMTPRESKANAIFAFCVSIPCSAGDILFSAMGFYAFFESRAHQHGWGTVLYVLVSGAMAGAVAVGIRYTRIRITSYAASNQEMRTNTKVLGSLADVPVEQAVVVAENNKLNRILFICWTYEIASNFYVFARQWWPSIVPLFLFFVNRAGLIDALNGLVSIVAALGISYIIPWVGHLGESFGFKFWDHFDRATAQEALVIGHFQQPKRVSPGQTI